MRTLFYGVIMTKIKKIQFPECRYKVTDFHIIDTEKVVNNGREIYIRAILDSACSEYNSLKLPNEERLDIVDQLGLDNLIALLAECFRVNHNNYNAWIEAYLTMFFSTGDHKYYDALKNRRKV